MSNPHDLLQEAEENLRRALNGSTQPAADQASVDAPVIHATTVGNVLSGSARIESQTITFNK